MMNKMRTDSAGLIALYLCTMRFLEKFVSCGNSITTYTRLKRSGQAHYTHQVKHMASIPLSFKTGLSNLVINLKW
jgi:hypothetical protein